MRNVSSRRVPRQVTRRTRLVGLRLPSWNYARDIRLTKVAALIGLVAGAIAVPLYGVDDVWTAVLVIVGCTIWVALFWLW
jgi:hypothetical protein